MFPEEEIVHEENSPDGSFDPYIHRAVSRPLTDLEALLSYIKICTGLGMMVSAEAVSHVGFVAVGLIPLLGLFLTYLLHVQFRSRYYLCRKLKVPYLSYPEALKFCLDEGPTLLVIIKNVSSVIVDYISVINQFGSSSICLMYIASTLEENFEISARNCVLFLVPFLMVFVFVNELKDLVPFNFIAMVLQLIGLAFIMYYIFTDIPLPTSRKIIQNPSCWALFVARILGATEAVAVVNAIERNMASPASFLKLFGVLNISMCLIIAVYFVCGIGGYIKYNPQCCVLYIKCQPLTSIIPIDEIPAYIAKAFYLTGLGLSYGIICFPAHSILWSKLFEQNFGSRKILKYLFRMAIIFGTVGFALISPGTSVAVSLILNTFCLSFLAIIFPTILHMCLLWPNRFGWLHIIYWWDLLLMLIGIFFIIVSMYQILWVAHQLVNGNFYLEASKY